MNNEKYLLNTAADAAAEATAFGADEDTLDGVLVESAAASVGRSSSTSAAAFLFFPNICRAILFKEKNDEIKHNTCSNTNKQIRKKYN
mgnify:CR=1 FL=1